MKTGLDQLSSIFGIEKQNHEIFIEKDPVISKANRYLRRCNVRLTKYAINKESEKYEQLSKILMEKSLAFQIGNFNFKCPTWYWAWEKKGVNEIFQDFLKLNKDKAYDIVYSRTWIPKGDDPVGRPLGAPSMPWRPYLYEMLYFADLWSEHNHYKKPWQHGGFAGRGVNTFIDDMIE
jgi:hypothetical protein